jgi:hypothetical protein
MQALQDDKLVEGWDVRSVVFITNTWLRSEVRYSDVSQPDVVNPNGISTKSKTFKKHTRCFIGLNSLRTGRYDMHKSS